MLAKLAVVISLVCMVGCARTTQVNYGAELPIYMASPQFMFEAIPAGVQKNYAMLRGFYYKPTGAIYSHEGMSPAQTMRTFAHELAHAYDDQRPADMWELLRRYHSPRFDFNFHKE